MKLCVVSPYPPRFLALGNYAKALLPEMLAEPDIGEVVALVDQPANRDITAPARSAVRVLRAWDPDSPLVLRQMLNAIKEERPDVVWFNAGFILGKSRAADLSRLSAPAIARSLGLVSVVTLHHMIEAEPLESLGIAGSRAHRMAGRMATRLLFHADRVCLTLRRYLGIAQRAYGATNATYIPHHVFHEPVPGFTRPWGTRLLAFGTLAPYKGLDVLIDAFGRASQGIPQLQLRIAGGMHPRFPLMVQTARAFPRRGVRWLGEISDQRIDELMAWADVVVVPSLAATGSSSVLHRAAGHGKPIVASALTDFRALEEEEHLAIEFVRPGDAEALARTLVRVCRDQDLRLRMARKNLEAAARLTPCRIAARYNAVFRSLLGQPQETEVVAAGATGHDVLIPTLP